MSEDRTISIPEEQAGQRLDKALTALCPDLSRARVQALIRDGQVTIAGRVCDAPNRKVRAGEAALLSIPALKPAEPQAEDIVLDILFEDEHMLVVNKPAGLVVHPGAGNMEGTLVNALIHHCGESLSGVGGVARPGIVHRLDKDTSGLMAVAKHDQAHRHLSAQLAERTLKRVYHAVVLKTPVPRKGRIERTVGRDPNHRLKMMAGRRDGRAAVTDYLVLEDYRGAASLVECRLQTGRTHQIRVHMQDIKHPLIGDRLYGPPSNALKAALKKADYDPEEAESILAFPRQALHARMLSFLHPETEEEIELAAPYPKDFSNLLNLLNK